MTLITKISKLLSLDKIQRICYLVALLLWIFMWKDDIYFHNSTSSLGIKYIWLIFIPTFLLILQVILNKTILWRAIFGLFFSFTIYIVFKIILNILERSGKHIKPITWDLKTLISLAFILGTLFIINWTIYKLKPLKNK